MINFYQFWDQLNPNDEDGTPKQSTYELKPLTPEDMCQTSQEDGVKEFLRLHKGKNPCALGKPMTDEELEKFYGQV